jgi:hypothetical protein
VEAVYDAVQRKNARAQAEVSMLFRLTNDNPVEAAATGAFRTVSRWWYTASNTPIREFSKEEFAQLGNRFLQAVNTGNTLLVENIKLFVTVIAQIAMGLVATTVILMLFAFTCIINFLVGDFDGDVQLENVGAAGKAVMQVLLQIGLIWAPVMQYVFDATEKIQANRSESLWTGLSIFSSLLAFLGFGWIPWLAKIASAASANKLKYQRAREARATGKAEAEAELEEKRVQEMHNADASDLAQRVEMYREETLAEQSSNKTLVVASFKGGRKGSRKTRVVDVSGGGTTRRRRGVLKMQANDE